MIYLIIGVLVFLTVFYLMITEKVPSAWATMLGGLVMACLLYTSDAADDTCCV